MLKLSSAETFPFFVSAFQSRILILILTFLSLYCSDENGVSSSLSYTCADPNGAAASGIPNTSGEEKCVCNKGYVPNPANTACISSGGVMISGISDRVSEGESFRFSFSLSGATLAELKEGENMKVSIDLSFPDLIEEMLPTASLSEETLTLNAANSFQEVTLSIEEDDIDQAIDPITTGGVEGFPAVLSINATREADISHAFTKNFTVLDNDQISPVFEPESGTAEFDEAADENIFSAALNKKPAAAISLAVSWSHLRRYRFTFSLSSPTDPASLTRRDGYFTLIFTRENWNVPQNISLNFGRWSLRNAGTSYIPRSIPFYIQYEGEPLTPLPGESRKHEYRIARIADKQLPAALGKFQVFSCSGSNYVVWESPCGNRGCDSSIQYQLFHGMESGLDETSSHIMISGGEVEILSYRSPRSNLHAHLHDSLTNGSPVYYRIRYAQTYSDGTSEESPFSAELGSTPLSDKSKNFVACPENKMDGSSSSYQVSTAEQLAQIWYKFKSNFELAGDISLPDDFPASSASTIIPYDFSGRFDGKGNTVSNLKKPLFDFIYGGEVMNLHLNVDMTMEVNKDYCLTSSVGTLANVVGSDRSDRGIHHVYTTGQATLVVNTPKIKSSCGILGALEVGGIVGTVNGHLSSSFSTVMITLKGKSGTEPIGTVSIGGVAGVNTDTGYIKNSFSTGSIAVEDASLNPGGADTRYRSHIGGVVGTDTNGGVTNTVFHSTSTYPAEGLDVDSGFSRTGILNDVVGEAARSNANTSGGHWGDPAIWNLGDDSQYPCLVGLPDIANHPDDLSVICSDP